MLHPEVRRQGKFAGDAGRRVVWDCDTEIALRGGYRGLRNEIGPGGCHVDRRGGVNQAGTEIVVEMETRRVVLPVGVTGADFSRGPDEEFLDVAPSERGFFFQHQGHDSSHGRGGGGGAVE